MSNDFDEEHNFDNIEARIAHEAVKKIDTLKAASGSYFELIPPEYQKRVDHMVEKYYPHYEDRFNTRHNFREAMARNWLTKREAFGNLAEAAGMKKIESMDDLSSDPNKARLAIITSSSSYLLVGEGAFDPQGKGASVEYVRIPLREGEEVSNFSAPQGGTFLVRPEVGERARIYNHKTSPVMGIYAVEGQGRPKLESGSVTETFINVDAKTMF